MHRQDQIAAFDVALSTLIRTFTINERKHPAAEGQAIYNARDFETLGYLASHPGAPAKDLGLHLGVSPTTTQSIVDRLRRKGLIIRDQDALKGRAVAIFLTEDGRSLQAAIARQNRSNCEHMLNCLPAAEREAFIKSISKIAETVSRNDKT